MNRYPIIKRKIDLKLQKVDVDEKDFLREEMDAKMTDDLWEESDYGHSCLDRHVCHALHQLYDRRDQAKGQREFDKVSLSDIGIAQLWKCQTKKQFRSVQKEFALLD